MKYSLAILGLAFLFVGLYTHGGVSDHALIISVVLDVGYIIVGRLDKLAKV